jgi:hypothetical protein
MTIKFPPPPGAIYQVSEPEYIGSFPVRQELEILPLDPNIPTPGQKEWSEHQSLMITLFGVGGEITDPNAMKRGYMVLVRSIKGGWYGPSALEKKVFGGLFVRLQVENRLVKVPVLYCSKRGCWITTMKV